MGYSSWSRRNGGSQDRFKWVASTTVSFGTGGRGAPIERGSEQWYKYLQTLTVNVTVGVSY